MDLFSIIAVTFVFVTFAIGVIGIGLGFYYNIRISLYKRNDRKKGLRYIQGEGLNIKETFHGMDKRVREVFLEPQEGDSDELLALKKGMRLAQRIAIIGAVFLSITMVLLFFIEPID